MAVADLRVMGRATQGVRLIKVKEGDSIAAVAKVMHDDDDIEELEGDLESDTPLDNESPQTNTEE